MKAAIVRSLKAFAASPWVTALTGLVLLGTGASEFSETLWDDILSLNLGAHHGVAMLGIVQIIQSLPSIIGGLEKTANVLDR